MNTLAQLKTRLQKIEKEINPPGGILILYGDEPLPPDHGKYSQVVRFDEAFRGTL